MVQYMCFRGSVAKGIKCQPVRVNSVAFNGRELLKAPVISIGKHEWNKDDQWDTAWEHSSLTVW